MPQETLEALRLLTNLETEKRKLLQVVLFGQPELDVRLAKTKFRQLRQRISFSYQLPRLQQHEVQCYVEERLQRAGASDVTLFSQAALWWLTLASRGIPRLVNIIAHKALLLSYGKGASQVQWASVWAAARDTDDVQLGRWQQLALVVGLSVMGVGLFWWSGRL